MITIHSEKLREAILNLNKALEIIEETSDILHEGIFDKEFEGSDEWRAMDVEAFCHSLRKSIKEHGIHHGYWYR